MLFTFEMSTSLFNCTCRLLFREIWKLVGISIWLLFSKLMIHLHLFDEVQNLTLEKVNKNMMKKLLSKCSLINLSSPKNLSNNCQIGLRRAPDSVIHSFKTRGKRTLTVIINDYKTVWGSFKILFLSWVIFINVFSHEKTGCNSAQGRRKREKGEGGTIPYPLDLQNIKDVQVLFQK